MHACLAVCIRMSLVLSVVCLSIRFTFHLIIRYCEIGSSWDYLGSISVTIGLLTDLHSSRTVVTNLLDYIGLNEFLSLVMCNQAQMSELSYTYMLLLLPVHSRDELHETSATDQR